MITTQDRIRIALLDGPGTASEVSAAVGLKTGEVSVRLNELHRGRFVTKTKIDKWRAVFELTAMGVTLARDARATLDLQKWAKYTAAKGVTDGV